MHKAEGEVPAKWAEAVKKGLWLWQELRGPTKQIEAEGQPVWYVPTWVFSR